MAVANRRRMTGVRQRYGLLLLALGVTFLFEGVAQPGDVQRAIGTILVGATLMLALYAAEIQTRLLRVAAAIVLTIVAGAVIASAVGKGSTVEGFTAIASGLMVALASILGQKDLLRFSGVGSGIVSSRSSSQGIGVGGRRGRRRSGRGGRCGRGARR